MACCCAIGAAATGSERAGAEGFTTLISKQLDKPGLHMTQLVRQYE